MQQLLQSLWIIQLMWKILILKQSLNIFADIEDADADTMIGQHEEVPRQMFLSIDNLDLDGMTVPLPPQPPPEEVATPVDHGSTYIQDMFDLDVLQKIYSGRQATKSQTERQC